MNNEFFGKLYCFEDRGNRRVALRPELTPSLARLVIQKGKSVSLPLKWFAIGQCWRYERMTRGRRREHYQWNMDIIGVPDVTVVRDLSGQWNELRTMRFPVQIPAEAKLLGDFFLSSKALVDRINP
ncbi:hypothetical protein KY290_019102 [Solanum tuberosum]|uniref:histidine--tRNA ligase n=1 Tax=Solanum tuberosum TaxID=4113 RepID=A0ABQ7VHG7_SOLTU|nr:hypothetical protein KY285_018064 [Solanum tuberosum]KAH0763029.1 hypothetical protein KY290_019102 [Solanum tuberosum]